MNRTIPITDTKYQLETQKLNKRLLERIRSR